MMETVDTEMLKTVSELIHILRWEDDGGAVSEGGHTIPRMAETNTSQSMSGAKNDSLYVELNNNHSKRDKE